MQLVIIVLAIGLQIFLTYKKLSPFLSLLIVALLAGLAFGMQPVDLLKAMKTGVGSTLGDVALIICLGAILGKILELSGAASQIANTLINSFGKKNIQWAILLTGFLVGIPLYYNAGFIILVPLVFSIARTAGLPLLYVAIPMAAGLNNNHNRKIHRAVAKGPALPARLPPKRSKRGCLPARRSWLSRKRRRELQRPLRTRRMYPTGRHSPAVLLRVMLGQLWTLPGRRAPEALSAMTFPLRASNHIWLRLASRARPTASSFARCARASCKPASANTNDHS